MLGDYREILIPREKSLRKTIATMDAGAIGFILVVDKKKRLLGAVTDGDIRRGLLRGLTLASPVSRAMQRRPITVHQGCPRDTVEELMDRHEIGQIPVLDEGDRVVGLELRRVPSKQRPRHDNWVVIPAGGMGKRLRPLTLETPKPLLKIGNRPLLNVLIRQIAENGFKNFLVTVHYKADRFARFVREQDFRELNVRFLREPRPLGTVGGVRLARNVLKKPFLMVNGDVLARVNYQHLLDYHRTHKNAITIAVKSHQVRIPYGVVKTSNRRVTMLEEKPSRDFLVNAGMYVIDPGMVPLIPSRRPFDTTELISAALLRKKKVEGFLLRDYWLDIGTPRDYKKSHGDYRRHFAKRKKR